MRTDTVTKLAPSVIVGADLAVRSAKAARSDRALTTAHALIASVTISWVDIGHLRAVSVWRHTWLTHRYQSRRTSEISLLEVCRELISAGGPRNLDFGATICLTDSQDIRFECRFSRSRRPPSG